VGDIAAMLTLAMSVGFKAMGATSRQLLGMIFVQAGLCAHFWAVGLG
jgi:hypothetical protein